MSGWCAILLIAAVCATPLGVLCLGRYSTLTVRVPNGITTRNLEAVAGWPMVFYHAMEIDAVVLPHQPKSVEVRVLRNSKFSFTVDLGIVIIFAAIVGWMLKRIFTRYRTRGRVWSGLALPERLSLYNSPSRWEGRAESSGRASCDNCCDSEM